MVDEAKQQGLVRADEDILAQSGHTPYVALSNGFVLKPFLDHDEYFKAIADARLVISHAGLSSIADSLNANKRIIAVPRLKKYREHQNDHQLQLVKKFGNEGYLVPCLEAKGLAAALVTAEDFVPRHYQSSTHEVIELVRDAIDGRC
jgi:UDP-N-acetylglucosamine transferase subunit ALG13